MFIILSITSETRDLGSAPNITLSMGNFTEEEHFVTLLVSIAEREICEPNGILVLNPGPSPNPSLCNSSLSDYLVSMNIN